jgi:hypothetical protein
MVNLPMEVIVHILEYHGSLLHYEKYQNVTYQINELYSNIIDYERNEWGDRSVYYNLPHIIDYDSDSESDNEEIGNLNIEDDILIDIYKNYSLFYWMKEHRGSWRRADNKYFALSCRLRVGGRRGAANCITQFNYNIFSDYHHIYNYYDKETSDLPKFPDKFIKEYNNWQNIKKVFIENYQNESKLKSIPQSVQNKIKEYEYKYRWVPSYLEFKAN